MTYKLQERLGNPHVPSAKLRGYDAVYKKWGEVALTTEEGGYLGVILAGHLKYNVWV